MTNRRTNRRDFYRILGPVPIGEGGFARVHRAEDRQTGDVVALKVPLRGRGARDRLRREIQVQTALVHPNVMPVVKYDSDTYRWFTMPVGIGNLYSLRPTLDEAELVDLLRGVTDGLAYAHQAGYVHRDITPPNLIALPNSGALSGRQWVVADWGLVRRPPGQTTGSLTRSGQLLGTEGYAAPETWDRAHDATPAADVYSLGRVIAWFLTGRDPAPNMPLFPPADTGPWRYVVSECTRSDPRDRPADMAALRTLLDQALSTPVMSARAQAEELVDRVRGGDRAKLAELIRLARAHPDDFALHVDELARLPADIVHDWAAQTPQAAAEIAQTMARLLREEDWGQRDLNAANLPLDWVLHVAQALAQQGELELLEDVVLQMARADEQWDRWSHNNQVVRWLAQLRDPEGVVVARAIHNAGAARTYLGAVDDGWAARLPSRALRGAFGA
jgi:serine/threonine protein kinase